MALESNKTPRRYVSRKRWDDLSCVHRNWRGAERMQVLHGYARSVEIEFIASYLDHSGVVIDFSSLSSVKNILENQFDHTLLVAEDDPLRESFTSLADQGAADIRLMQSVTLEGSAAWVVEHVSTVVRKLTDGRVSISRVEIREGPKNAVIMNV